LLLTSSKDDRTDRCRRVTAARRTFTHDHGTKPDGKRRQTSPKEKLHYAGRKTGAGVCLFRRCDSRYVTGEFSPLWEAPGRQAKLPSASRVFGGRPIVTGELAISHVFFDLRRIHCRRGFASACDFRAVEFDVSRRSAFTGDFIGWPAASGS